MRKFLSVVLCLCMVFTVTTVVSADETDRLVMKKIPATDKSVTIVHPARMDEMGARIQYTDSVKGAGGMQISFKSDKNGLKKK